MKFIFKKLVLTALIVSSVSVQAEDKHPETGRWITESGNLEVEIAPCGDALCGTVVSVLANRSMSRNGETVRAADNRSPLGMTLLSGFTKDNGSEWHGKIYNRENAETYDCIIELISPDQLKVRAYKGIPLFGKTQVWNRVTGGRQ